MALGNVLLGDARLQDALNAAETVVHAALVTGDARALAMGYLSVARTRMRIGDRPATDAALTAAAELPITRHAGNVAGRFFAQLEAAIAMLEGRFDDAANIADEAARQTSHHGWGMVHFVQHQAIRAQTGRLKPDVLDRVADQWPDYPALRSGAALAHAEAGDTDRAHAQLEELERDELAAVSFGQGQPLSLRQLAETCAHLGDAVHAAALHELLAPYDGQLLVPYGGSSCEGAAARGLAQLETVLRRFDEAERHFDAALALEEGFGGRSLVPRTRYWYARMLQARGHTGDVERANQLLDTALAETENLGMQTLHRLAAAARHTH